MAKIININIGSTRQRLEIQELLGYAVKKREGRYNKMCRRDFYKEGLAQKLDSAGLLNIVCTSNDETFKITKSGDQYYKDMFGKYDYWKKRITGLLEKFINTILNKEKL